jgi:MoxR-like ATPase
VKPSELSSFLDGIVRHSLNVSTMIWGAPGIGKSSIVAQTAERHGLDFIDVRLSQLAPTDLRGLPVADPVDSVSRWFPPEFLPRTGRGVLFLDEINMAPPTMMGMAQQLILDRRVGSYVLPDGWFVWAAGNRKEDRATVFDMPSPLANRFIHLDVESDLESFKDYALGVGMHEQIISFLMFRPELLHKLNPQHPAWPSPRSWAMADKLHRAGLPVAAAIGSGVATEFAAYCALYAQVPDLAQILTGDGDQALFPVEPSIRYATVVGLTARSHNDEMAFNGFQWLVRKAGPEWVQLCAVDLFRQMGLKGHKTALFKRIAADTEIQAWIAEHRDVFAPEPSAAAEPAANASEKAPDQTSERDS